MAPLTIDEIKKVVMEEFEEGERAYCNLLEDRDSELAAIIQKLNVTREVLSELR